MRLNTLLLFSISLVFQSCKEETVIEPKLLSGDIKSYCCFESGSYWIYKEESTNQLDTLEIYTVNKGIEDGSDIYPYEYFEMLTSWSSYGYLPDRVIHMVAIADQNLKFGNVSYLSERRPHHNYLNFAYSDIPMGDSVSNFQNELICDTIYPTYIVSGVEYYDVKQVRLKIPFESNEILQSWWAPQVGRIKYITSNGEIWSLIEKHIVK